MASYSDDPTPRHVVIVENMNEIATCTSWAANMHETTTNMLTRLSDKLCRFACGFSPPATAGPHPHHGDDGPRAWLAGGFSSLDAALLLPPGGDDDESSCASSSWSSRVVAFAADRVREEPAAVDGETTLPCVAFPSQHGYMVFSLAENRMRDGVRLRPMSGCRVVPSPYGGGAAFATDLSCFRHPSRLVDPFTGESAPLPDLPVPLGERGPSPFEPEEPRVQGRRPAAPPTDDGFAWDRSPRGTVVARGDTLFFCERGGGGRWVPVHWAQSSSGTMTVNYRGGFFFVLERRGLLTTVIDAWTLEKVAEIRPPPSGDAVDSVHLVASTDDVLLLVHRAGDTDCELFSEVYRARHKKPKPEWSKVTNIGDRALFVDRLHGFSVGVVVDENAGGVKRNCVYTISATPVEDPQGRRVAVYHVEEFRVNRPEVGETLKSQLGSCLVEMIWGEPYWMIIPKNRMIVGDSIVGRSST
jgi:hypothetical protein